jgi:hypothetical protein
MKTIATDKTHDRSLKDPSPLASTFLNASILTGVCDALQIPRDFLEPT